MHSAVALEGKGLKKNIFILCFFVFSVSVFGQTIKAEKDLLCKIPLGYGENEVYYYATEEYWKKPKGVYINQDGELVFCFLTSNKDDNLLKSCSCSFIRNKFNVSLEDRFYNFSMGTLTGQNLCTYNVDVTTGSVFTYIDNGFKKVELSGFKKPGNGNNIEYIPVEKGFLVDSSFRTRDANIVGIEIENGRQVRIINKYELNDWLKTQKGNFEVKSDYLLYKNGMIYSNRITSDELFKIVARLPSGHCIYTKDQATSEFLSVFVITRPTGEYELEVEIPWAINLETFDGCYYDFSFGNYGEMYALITPEIKDADEPYNHTFTKGNAELVCVRNYLKYFGVLTDDRIRLRSESTTSSESLGTYPINTGFRILEKGTKQETIGGDTGVWYKVRLLDGKEGWFFGAYVRDLYDGPGTPLPWPNVADWK